MRGKLWFVGGLAVGFVLGARAGRERYEELVLKGRQVLDHPTVQEAAGVAQAQANRLYTEGKDRLSQTRLGEKLGTGNGGSAELGAGSDGSQVDSGTGSATKTSSGTKNSTSSSTSTSSGTSASTSSGTKNPSSSSTTTPASRAAASGSGANGTTF